MKLNLSFLLALMLVLTLGLAACSSGGEEVTGEADTETSDEASDEGNQEEQVLIYARGGDSTSLDFASVSDGESSRVTKNIFESLLDYDRDSFEVVPGLAHDWEVSDDGWRMTDD